MDVQRLAQLRKLIATDPVPRRGTRWLALASVLGLAGFVAVAFPTFARAGNPVPSSPPEKSGILLIAGGGNLPDAIRKRFLDLAGGASARIVVIPTASILADEPDRLPTYAYFKTQKLKSITLLHTRDRQKANEAGFIKPLLEATGVWMTGGDQSRIAATYQGTAVEQELKKVLARGGIIGGTSAGAAAMSSLMIVGGVEEARVGTGLGLLAEIVVDQHFQNRNRLRRLLGVLARHPERPGVGIDEETALIVQGRSATVTGNGNVRACLGPCGMLPASVQVLKDGEKLDLEALIKAASARGKSATDAKVPMAPRSAPAVIPDRALLSKP